MPEKILITSALPYVNNVPHMGNIIGCVLSADVFARFQRSQGRDVLYICGTDEHGTTTETKAMEEGLTPRAVCDKYYAIHKEVYDWFRISFDIFGRTSEENHHQITRAIFAQLKTNGYIIEKDVEQLYDEKEQKFLADRFVQGTCPYCKYEQARGDQCEHCGKLLDPLQLKNPVSSLSNTKPVKKKSTHLYLDLEKLQPDVEKWFTERSQQGKWTQNAISTTRAWLQKGLEPRAITRDLNWGVPVPGMEGKVFYVWFDAPIGYISITEQHTKAWRDWWQSPDVKLYQFMAKDNIPFHTILFPASLMGTKEPWTTLHHINVTEYLQHEDGKFSKSRGTGLFGDDAMKTGISADVYRYYLLINRPETADSMFAWHDLQDKINNELVANLGNLVNRTLTFIANYHESTIHEAVLTEKDTNFIEWVVEEEAMITADLALGKEKDALKRIMTIASKANVYFQEEAPWKTRKEDPDEAKRTMYVLANILKDLAILIEPFMPGTSTALFSQLGIDPLPWADLGNISLEDHTIGKPAVLFEKLDDDQLITIKAKLKEKSAPKERKPLQVKIGRIVDVSRHPDADKLFVEQVDFGDEIRTIVSGLVGHVREEDLRGKTALFVTNLQPAKLRGIASAGMILAAEGDDKDGNASLEVVFAPGEAGDLVLGTADAEQLTFEEFQQHSLETKDGNVFVNGQPFLIKDKPVTTKTVLNGKVR